MANVENNDNKILELRESIRKKKEEIGKAPRFNPITNCNLTYLGINYNLNVLKREDCILLGGILSALKLGIQAFAECKSSEANLSGFSIDEWLSDLSLRIKILKTQERQKELKAMETRLESLLSLEKQTELSISEIEKLLS